MNDYLKKKIEDAILQYGEGFKVYPKLFPSEDFCAGAQSMHDILMPIIEMQREQLALMAEGEGDDSMIYMDMASA